VSPELEIVSEALAESDAGPGLGLVTPPRHAAAAAGVTVVPGQPPNESPSRRVAVRCGGQWPGPARWLPSPARGRRRDGPGGRHHPG
jgi:hypothetical protein